MDKKYNIDSIYTTKNTIKISVNQTGSKAMIREKDQDKATMRQGFRVVADNETLVFGEWETTEKDVLLEAIKRERYAHLAYKEAYFDLIQKLSSIGFIQASELEVENE